MSNLVLNNKVIGVIKNDCVGYFNKALPDTPFSNFYITSKPFKLWLYPQRKAVSPKPLENAGKAHVGLFSSVEQVFAFGKAYVMHDKESMRRIYNLHTNSSFQYKRLGRNVKNYNDKLWKRQANNWMKTGMQAKFEQDKFSQTALSLTKNYKLVEANPYDHVWGAGCDINGRFDRATGNNKQGALLMEVRDSLMN